MKAKEPKHYLVQIELSKGAKPVILYKTQDLENELRPYHTLIAAPGDTVEWESRHPVTIHFGWPSPLATDSFTLAKGSSRTLQAPVAKAYGRFKYFVAIWDGKNILVDDPEIIVKPGGGPH